MTSERIKEIQQQTAYPDSISVQQALLQVWNECSQLPQQETLYTEEEVLELLLKSKIETSNLYYEDMKEWFEKYKKC